MTVNGYDSIGKQDISEQELFHNEPAVDSYIDETIVLRSLPCRMNLHP